MLPGDNIYVHYFLSFLNFCSLHSFIHSFIYLFIFLAALGLRCSERGLLFAAVRRLLIAVASLVAEHGL